MKIGILQATFWLKFLQDPALKLILGLMKTRNNPIKNFMIQNRILENTLSRMLNLLIVLTNLYYCLETFKHLKVNF